MLQNLHERRLNVRRQSWQESKRLWRRQGSASRLPTWQGSELNERDRLSTRQRRLQLILHWRQPGCRQSWLQLRRSER